MKNGTVKYFKEETIENPFVTDSNDSMAEYMRGKYPEFPLSKTR